MTDKQDPITHAARLLREAAEELRQAHTLSSDRNNWIGEPEAKAAYDEHMAAAQALEDWEAAVGAGGVQALSAAPATVSSTQHSQFLSDVLTAAGLVTHGKQCKALGERLADMVMRLRAAPQQEAQEPALFVSPKQLAALTDPDDPEGEHGRYLPARKTSKGLFTQPLYAAPQPAPAPLSEMPYEKRKAIQEGEQIGASDAWFKARHEMLDTVDRRNVFRAGFDRGWSAALAAQGGK